MELKENLRRIRIERGLTQAKLAEALGVSDRAVSRWERGAACPDVSLLPRLALLLETSVDALLGVDPLRSQAEILRATEESTRLLNENDAPAAVALLREKSALYPNQPELMVYLALALLKTGTEEALREALLLCRAADGRKMRLSTTFGCKQTMALCLSRLGRKEEAARLVTDEMPAIFVSRELLLARVAPAEQALRIRRSNADLLAGLLVSTLERLSRDMGDARYAEAAATIRNGVEALPSVM